MIIHHNLLLLSQNGLQELNPEDRRAVTGFTTSYTDPLHSSTT